MRLRRLVPQLGDACTPRVAIVDEHRRAPGVGMMRDGDATDVPAITDREQWKHADCGVFGRMQRAWQPVVVEVELADQVVIEDVPERPRVELIRWDVEALTPRQWKARFADNPLRSDLDHAR